MPHVTFKGPAATRHIGLVDGLTDDYAFHRGVATPVEQADVNAITGSPLRTEFTVDDDKPAGKKPVKTTDDAS